MEGFGIIAVTGQPGAPGEGKEKNCEDGAQLKTLNERAQTGLDRVPLDNGDGMKTHEEITGYDPIANPTDNPLQNKQGVGRSGYDFNGLF